MQSVYILTEFYAPDLFLENAELPATSIQETKLKECSRFTSQLYSLSQSDAGISISIRGVKNALQTIITFGQMVLLTLDGNMVQIF